MSADASLIDQSGPNSAQSEPTRTLKEVLIDATKSPAFIPGVIAFLGVIFAFWPLVRQLPKIWIDNEYYSHGWVVLPAIAYMLYTRRDDLSKTPVRPFYPALIFIVGLLFLVRASMITDVREASSIAMVLSLICAVWFVAGGKWAWKTWFPIAFLASALPIWDSFLDEQTAPLRIVSTEISYWLLKVTGFEPFRADSTFIHLNNFQLNVGAPCSGLKILIAITAIALCIIYIARLNFWANLIMVASILPFCLLVNGIRIALIGVCGEFFGNDAGQWFHDYGAVVWYALAVVVFIKFAKVLGWKI